MIYILLLLLHLLLSIETKIVYAGTVIRHGARYPLRGDIYDGNASKENFGRLTTVGMRQHFLLGSYMRADYIDKLSLINSTMYNKQVEIFSDGSQRCKQSAQSYCLGLFPFGSGEKIPQNIDKEMLKPPFSIEEYLRKEDHDDDNFALNFGYEPVPIRDGTSSFFKKCKNENKILEKRIQSLAVKIAEFQAIHSAFTQKMRLVFNLSTQFANIAGLAQLFDVVTCDMFLGRQLPQNFTDYDYQQLTYIHDYLFSMIYGGEPSHIFSTPILSGILGNMENRVKNGTNEVKKYSVYSGHDTTIMPILMFFNLTTPECLTKKWKNQTVSGNCVDAPPFASSLVLQLHQNDGQITENQEYFVKVRYNGQYVNLCGSSQKECDFSKFSGLVKSQLVDYAKVCQLTQEQVREFMIFQQ